MADPRDIRVTVDRSTCIGNGVCAVLAPLAFRLDDQMKAVVTDPGRESVDSLWAAAEACPVQAIYLSAQDQPLYP